MISGTFWYSELSSSGEACIKSKSCYKIGLPYLPHIKEAKMSPLSTLGAEIVKQIHEDVILFQYLKYDQ